MQLYKTLAITFLAIVLSACSSTATFYPIDGPLSQQNPLPVLTATVDGILRNTGEISISLPDGEHCTGKWSVIAPTVVGFSTLTTSDAMISTMFPVWTTVYGSEFLVNNIGGANRGQAMLVGNRNTIIQIEFYTGSGTSNGFGVAKDNKGNVYKVLF